MSYVVYILYSQQSLRYYTGHTQNLENRLSEHNNGETSSIKPGIPWKLVWQTQCNSRSEAIRLENKIKKRGAKRFLQGLSRGA
jgi:putative endonuclease